MTHRLKSTATAVAIALAAGFAADVAATDKTAGHAERVYEEYAAASGHAISFEVETLSDGPMRELAGRPYDSVMEAPSYLVRNDGVGARFEPAAPRATRAKGAGSGSSVDEFEGTGHPVSQGRYRLLAVIVRNGAQTRMHEALELCWSDHCVLLDPSVELGDALAGVPGAEPASAPAPKGTTTPGLSTKRSELLAAHNAQRRAKCGSGSLSMTTNINEAALYHAKDMATENYFSHDSKNPFERWYDRIDRFITRPVGGENIAYGYSTVSGVMQGWMNSDGHRRNIMDCSFKYVGFGYAENPDSNGKRYWVADFAY